MTLRDRPERKPWRAGLGGLRLGGSDQVYATLLTALVRDRLESELLERELDAPAAESPRDVQHDQERLQEEELKEAHGEVQSFRDALRDARARSTGSPRAEVSYDSRRADQDEMADALIQYLVRPGYAEVRTEEVADGGFVYWISVDWPRLRALAEELGGTLPED
jgi:hypothetical protein